METSMANESQAAGAAIQVKRGPGRPRKAPLTPPPSETQGPSDHKYFCGSVPVSGKCYKIKIIANGKELRFPNRVPLKLGDLPRIRITANQVVIVPEEYVSVLRDTTVDVPKAKNYREGEELEYETLVRIPFQILGEVTWDEWLAFRDAQAKKPVAAPTVDPYANL
jgi:hypothetical protein